VDFERVVSYDNAVSDDDRASEIYGKKETAADLPEPVASSESPTGESESSSSPSSGASGSPSADASGDEDGSPSATPSDGDSATSTPAALQPRTLDNLGDESFLDDALSGSQQRTVTVVFRTSNVVVTIQYDEQPATTTDVPSSEEMQDRAQKLAGQLAETFSD
jgi:hypothetical protein